MLQLPRHLFFAFVDAFGSLSFYHGPHMLLFDFVVVGSRWHALVRSFPDSPHPPDPIILVDQPGNLHRPNTLLVLERSPWLSSSVRTNVETKVLTQTAYTHAA